MTNDLHLDFHPARPDRTDRSVVGLGVYVDNRAQQCGS